MIEVTSLTKRYGETAIVFGCVTWLAMTLGAFGAFFVGDRGR